MGRVFAITVLAFATSGAAIAQTLEERGDYLMNAVAACGNCHTPQTPEGPAQDMELAGMFLEERRFFIAYAPNITPASRIADWSDDELKRAIREGVRPDGSLIGPPMPFALYRGLADDDLAAITAYMRQVPPVENDLPSSEYRMPMPTRYGPPVESVTAPSKEDMVAYGEYIAGPLAHCIECHSTPGPFGGPDIEDHKGGGGMVFSGPWGESTAPNITSAALGDWSDEEIEAAIRQGVRPDGQKLMPPMGYGYYANMSDEDMTALIAYLRTLPPL